MPTLDALVSQFCSEQMELGDFLAASLKSISIQVQCQRAGLFCLQGTAPDRVLRCVRLYDRGRDCLLHIPEQHEPLVTDYVTAFAQAGTIRAFDVQSNPATQRLFSDKILQTGVRSLMSRAFSINGDLIGAFTCAQLDHPHVWTDQQLAILSKASSAVALALARKIPSLHETICELPNEGQEISPIPQQGDDGDKYDGE